MISEKHSTKSGKWTLRFREKLIQSEIFRKIRQLAHMSSLGSRLALSVVLFLGRQSFPEKIDQPEEFRGRALDEEMDLLMVEVVTNVKEEDLEFKPTAALKSLKFEMSFLTEHGIHSYFKKSYNLLLTWLPEIAATNATSIAHHIRTSVQYEASLVEQRLKNFRDDDKIPPYDWFGESLKRCIHEIRDLSGRPKGLGKAIELVKRTQDSTVLDPRCDELLMELLGRAREEDPEFSPTEDFIELERSFDELANYNIPPYFPKFYELLCSWDDGDEASESDSHVACSTKK
ncbi:uncharacterized protein PAC_10346 [Phialocephala subalpina]|uniref:Uncharacterized protein n=1 Tax=Phialocephala subalpina TaxID=576137 RepID=A0A1L7X5Z8_9HELO|nr:uncharacterized protein PAC_10346 [Phialocephala subalpina]